MDGRRIWQSEGTVVVRRAGRVLLGRGRRKSTQTSGVGTMVPGPVRDHPLVFRAVLRDRLLREARWRHGCTGDHCRAVVSIVDADFRMEAAAPTAIGACVGVSVKHAARLTGAVALAGGIIAWLGIVLHLAATSLEVDLIQHAPSALSLPIPRQELYIYSLWCAAFGLYLPFLLIGNF